MMNEVQLTGTTPTVAGNMGQTEEIEQWKTKKIAGIQTCVGESFRHCLELLVDLECC